MHREKLDKDTKCNFILCLWAGPKQLLDLGVSSGDELAARGVRLRVKVK